MAQDELSGSLPRNLTSPFDCAQGRSVSVGMTTSNPVRCGIKFEKNKMDLPTRDNLLTVLNLDEKSRTQTANILACLPKTFPKIPSWEMGKLKP
jgi:hypothetical protein